MGRSPSDGVVDGDCRVHEVSNLFVAGGATFPRSGYAPPTLTMLALAFRLSDHLRSA
jgi:choline dehydrogenase-like flavoprotein